MDVAMTDLKYTCDQIIDIDNKIRDLVRNRGVLSISDVHEFRRLKNERKWFVTTLLRAGKSHRS
jgi:hypothetical protein